MKKKKHELRQVRNYRATDLEEELIEELYLREIDIYVKTNKTTVNHAKKTLPYSRWKVAKLLKKSLKVLI